VREVAAKQGRTREALEVLSKDELVTRAEALGIDGARKFTRVELIDEITRASGEGDRGLLGRARDLLRQVVEKGLAVPASQAPPALNSKIGNGNGNGNGNGRIRGDLPASPVPTVTLAEIYLAQGHPTRARAILREVVRNNEDDQQARALLERIERREVRTGALHAGEQVSSPPIEKPIEPAATIPDDAYARIGIEPEAFAEPVNDEASAVPPMLDDAPLPARYNVDECVAIAVDPTTVYVYWEARRRSAERARNALQRFGSVECTSTLRVLVVEPTDQGPRVSTRDFDVIDIEFGEWFVRDLPAASLLRAAIGFRAGERFLPIAHTLDVEAPAASASSAVATEVVVWTESGTHAPTGDEPRIVRAPLARTAGTFGLPPLPEAPEDEVFGRGLSSAELSRRARVARARAAAKERPDAEARPGPGASDLLAAPGSSSWLGTR